MSTSIDTHRRGRVCLRVRLPLFVLCAAFIATFPALAADAAESNDMVRVHSEKRGDAVDLYVTNLQTYAVAVTLDFESLQNMEVDADLPLTFGIPGGETRKAVTLRSRNRQRSGRFEYVCEWKRGVVGAKHDDSAVYYLPFAPGTSHKVSQGAHGEFSHYGEAEYAYDFSAPKNTPVYAAREGVVVGVDDHYKIGGPDAELIEEGNYIIIEHPDRTYGEYFHLQTDGARVRVGQRVRAGELIGYSGNTGYTTAPHLHFAVHAVRRDGRRYSAPIRFRTDQGGAIFLEEGRYYTAVYPEL